LSRRPLAALSLGLLLLAWAEGCASQEAGLADLQATDVTRKVRVFLISPGDKGASGRKVGCGDRAVPVAVSLDRAQPALFGALEALLAEKREHVAPSGLSNPLYASRLSLERIDRQGAQAKVYLSGYLEVGGPCDAPRLLAQLTETALQFRDVQHVQLYLDGKLLPGLLRAVAGSTPVGGELP
jgi:hypothetical protein